MNKTNHNPDGLVRAFMDKYSKGIVPVKKWGSRRHDGTRYKPETGNLMKANFYFI